MKSTVVAMGIWVTAWSLAATAGWNENLVAAAMITGLVLYGAVLVRIIGGPRKAYAGVRDLVQQRLDALTEWSAQQR